MRLVVHIRHIPREAVYAACHTLSHTQGGCLCCMLHTPIPREAVCAEVYTLPIPREAVCAEVNTPHTQGGCLRRGLTLPPYPGRLSAQSSLLLPIPREAVCAEWYTPRYTGRLHYAQRGTYLGTQGGYTMRRGGTHLGYTGRHTQGGIHLGYIGRHTQGGVPLP